MSQPEDDIPDLDTRFLLRDAYNDCCYFGESLDNVRAEAQRYANRGHSTVICKVVPIELYRAKLTRTVDLKVETLDEVKS